MAGVGTETLITQVQHLLAGRLTIPSIQRGYVWKKAQVPDLLDSLYRAYPVGSLLIWHTDLEVPLKRAAVVQGVDESMKAAVLLDGQQRLTSLAKVVAPDRVTGGALDVRFDLDAQVFLNPSATERRRPRLLPVTVLLADAPQFGEILASAGIVPGDPFYDEAYERIRRVHRIREYSIPRVTIESNDYEQVADIFARVNQGGRRLSKGDLVYSAIAARWAEGLDVIESYNAELDQRNFALDREAVLRLTGLLAGTGAHVIKLIGKGVTGDDLKRAWGDTEKALGYAVDFLQGECGIPRSGVLSSPNVVAIPAYMLFKRRNVMSPADTGFLRRWVYTTMAFSYYSNQVEGKLDADARAVRERTGSDLHEELIRRASGARPVGTSIEPSELMAKGSTSSWFNLLYVAALRNHAKDWHSNQALVSMPMSSDSRIEYHHVFPKARVTQRYGRDTTNSIANFAFISGATNRKIAAKAPSDYLATIPRERLAEQWVPHNAALWSDDDFPAFLAQRRLALANVLNELLGLPAYLPGSHHDVDSEAPHDDEELEVESTSSVPLGRRDVALHIQACFDGMPEGAELTVAEIVAAPSSQYGAGEVSPGAVGARLRAGTVAGIETVPGRTPLTARAIAGTTRVVSPPPRDPGSSTAGPTESDRVNLFHREMAGLYVRSEREVGYRPTAFRSMVAEHGGVETARRLVTAAQPSDGFTTLWEARRLDLTAEALVVDDRFSELFAPEVVERARDRLRQFGFVLE